MPPRSSIAAATVALALLVGCGSSNDSATIGGDDNGESRKSGPQVAKDATDALVEAGSVRITGFVDTTDLTGKSVKADVVMNIQRDGSVLSLRSGTYTIDSVSVGGNQYVKFGGGAGIPLGPYNEQITGQWLRSDDKAPAITITTFGKDLIDSGDFGPIEPGVTVTSLDGRPTVVVSSSSGSKLWVAATGKPYPLQVTLPRTANSKSSGGAGQASAPSTGPGTLKFGDFGERVPLATPSPIVDVSSLQPSMGPIPSASPVTPVPSPS